MDYDNIKKALKDNYRIHGFRSGGGLRVLVASREGSKKEFYGESCDLSEALRILNDDIAAGGRKYENVYGPIELHYLTGAYSTDDDVLDAWVCSGHPFDIRYENEEFVIDMSMKEEASTPNEIADKVSSTLETIFWKFTNQPNVFKSSPYRFANDTFGCQTESIPKRSGIEQAASQVKFPRVSKSQFFDAALKEAEKLTLLKYEPEWFIIDKMSSEQIESMNAAKELLDAIKELQSL